jgi:hypothetical protein
VNSASWLVPLPVLLPLVGAGITLAAARRTQVQRFVSMTVLTAVVAVSGYLLFSADREGPQVMHVGGWMPTEGIVLVVDRLSALMVIVSAIVTMGVLQYAIGQGRSSFDEESDGEAPLPVFHPTLLVLNAGVSTTFISGDLFHIYVGFEMLLAASFVPRGHRVAGPGRHHLRLRQPAVLDAVPGRDRDDLRGHGDGEPRAAGLAPAGAAARDVGRAAPAAHPRLLRQGRGVPDVRVAPGLLPDRARAGHGGVRRPADQGRSGPRPCSSPAGAWTRCCSGRRC